MSDRTPEEQKAYDEEMKRLEAAAPAKELEKASEQKVEPVTKADVEKLEKALKDTQRWAHQNAAEVARLKREAEERKHSETRPAILDANPGLEDAIKHVAPKVQEKSKDEVWLESVQRAIPDVEGLLADAQFHAKAKTKQAELGEAWTDPLIAIRELSDLRAGHIRDQALQGAIEQARKDFEEKSQKRSAMSVPGGSGAKASPEKDDEAERIRNMSDADFRKMRAKTLGFNT